MHYACYLVLYLDFIARVFSWHIFHYTNKVFHFILVLFVDYPIFVVAIYLFVQQILTDFAFQFLFIDHNLSADPQNLLIPKQEPTTEQASPAPSTDSTINSTDNINNNNPTTPSTSALPNSMSAPSGRQPVKRRARRRATSQSQDPAEQLTEMSVRGLNLFRYASINEGVYQCTECAKVDVQKTFKNKYSFQRHAFLYHEGHQRKVFPCPVCQKEFSRPDKMKNHMKTVHDCFMPKDCVFPMGFFLQQ